VHVVADRFDIAEERARGEHDRLHRRGRLFDQRFVVAVEFFGDVRILDEKAPQRAFEQVQHRIEVFKQPKYIAPGFRDQSLGIELPLDTAAQIVGAALQFVHLAQLFLELGGAAVVQKDLYRSLEGQ
jgi:hypothetical protein